MRYTGHLDLHRSWERTLRRAGLPLAYSQGFKPHPRIVLACALPLGCTSQHELVDIWLEEQIPTERIKAALERVAPPGLQILDIAEADPAWPALPTQMQAVEYSITLRTPFPGLDAVVQQVMSAEALPRLWRDKKYDLRPLISQIRLLVDDDNGCQRILVTLAAREGSTGRPDEVLRALGVEPEQAHIQRTALIFQSSD
jgi:radical SAM-linked protein